MDSAPIPVRLTLVESTAAALAEAADDLSAATDPDRFVAALDINHRLWLTLVQIAADQDWHHLNRHLADFVVSASRTAGRGLSDERLETLVEINREVSKRLTSGRPLPAIRQRAKLAWQERGRPYGLPLDRWLISEMERQARVAH
ncbi:MAG: DUF2934 domain-containing protein [Magnetospirillum sp.]|nr:DUF2934 domain-containing protein [Magnetospirillum sp.]